MIATLVKLAAIILSIIFLGIFIMTLCIENTDDEDGIYKD